jgi:biopolymer transport protein ExbB
MEGSKRLMKAFLRIFFLTSVFGVLCAIANAQTRPAAPTTQNTQQATVSTHPPDMSVLQLLARGGWFMVPIGAMSLVGFALILERAVALRRGKIIPRRFMRDLKRVAPGGSEDRETALRYCREHPSPISRVMAAGLRKLPQGHCGGGAGGGGYGIERGAEAAAEYADDVWRHGGGADDGTAGDGVGDDRCVSGYFQCAGIGQAGAAGQGNLRGAGVHAGGLMVAIPVLVVYYYFIAKIERLVAEMNENSLEFADHFLERAGRKAQAATLETVLKSEI